MGGLAYVPHCGVQYPILPFCTPEKFVPLGYTFCTPFGFLSFSSHKLVFLLKAIMFLNKTCVIFVQRITVKSIINELIKDHKHFLFI